MPKSYKTKHTETNTWNKRRNESITLWYDYMECSIAKIVWSY